MPDWCSVWDPSIESHLGLPTIHFHCALPFGLSILTHPVMSSITASKTAKSGNCQNRIFGSGIYITMFGFVCTRQDTVGCSKSVLCLGLYQFPLLSMNYLLKLDFLSNDNTSTACQLPVKSRALSVPVLERSVSALWTRQRWQTRNTAGSSVIHGMSRIYLCPLTHHQHQLHHLSWQHLYVWRSKAAVAD